MLAYAASRPVVVDRRTHPNAMLLIIGAHVAALALVTSAKMDLPRRIFEPPIRITMVPKPPVPPAHAQQTKQPNHATRNDTVDHPRPQVQTGLGLRELNSGGQVIGLNLPPIDLTPIKYPPIKLDPVKSGPQLLTPASELKPPYPASKLDSGEEAILTLKLRIDESGHVVAVDPVGRADAVFLEAARRYLVAHWRYKPATEDGEAVASSMVITLHFELNG